MPASMIENHLSFRPATEVIRSREVEATTLTPASRAKAELARVGKLIRVRPSRGDNTQLTAQTWGATKQGARRSVLRAAGLEPSRWDCPIHSFSESERTAIKAAAAEAVRVFERVLHAI